MQAEGGRFESDSLHSKGGEQYARMDSSNYLACLSHRLRCEEDVMVRGNDVVWTIAGILFIICQIVWLVHHVNL